jgi:hypothetical protein
LNAAEVAPTECLVDHEENDVLSIQILIVIKLHYLRCTTALSRATEPHRTIIGGSLISSREERSGDEKLRRQIRLQRRKVKETDPPVPRTVLLCTDNCSRQNTNEQNNFFEHDPNTIKK